MGTRLETARITKGNGKRALLIKTVNRNIKLIGHHHINGSTKRCRGISGSLKKQGIKT